MLGYIKKIAQRPLNTLRWKKHGVQVSVAADCIGTLFEGKSKIYPGANVSKCFIGRGSYVGPNSNLSSCLIGRYCSVGPGVVLVAGKHPTDEFLSTHPAFYSPEAQAGFSYTSTSLYDEFNYVDEGHQYYAEIGSDVWIGANVVILAGVRIGHGAIIAAGSVVTKSVDDFSIMAGVPAKFIRFRFDENRRAEILTEPWWSRDETWIIENLKDFQICREVGQSS